MKDNLGWTALSKAGINGYKEVVDLFLKKIVKILEPIYHKIIKILQRKMNTQNSPRQYTKWSKII